jgi:uncharacterized protein (UPF0261 family)
MSTFAVLGTLDTKAREHAFVAECIRAAGHAAWLIDVGTSAAPGVEPQLTRAQVLQAALDAGQIDSSALPDDRGAAVALMARAAPVLLGQLVAAGKIQGVISLGGSGGTAIATAAMRSLPLGFPKVMVSTLAGGDVSQYIGVSDLVMMPSIVDIVGINRISRGVLARAAAALVGMAQANQQLAASSDDKPLIVASMFGNTTQCVEHARRICEQAGYEVLVFHATGAGGRSMESLIASGLVAGVLDITTTEWADQLCGGVLSAGPTRLEAAARQGVPAIVVPGCLDMVNFGPPHTVPESFAGRKFYQHNPQITLMRTTPEECSQLGQILAEKINGSQGPVRVLLPRRAISVISAAGGAFHDPAADAALFRAIHSHLRSDIPVQDFELEINDPEFAAACATTLLELIRLASLKPAQT